MPIPEFPKIHAQHVLLVNQEFTRITAAIAKLRNNPGIDLHRLQPSASGQQRQADGPQTGANLDQCVPRPWVHRRNDALDYIAVAQKMLPQALVGADRIQRFFSRNTRPDSKRPQKRVSA